MSHYLQLMIGLSIVLPGVHGYCFKGDPCVIREIVHDTITRRSEYNARSICNCNSSFACDNKWADKGRMITTKVYTKYGYKLRFLKFCKNVVPGKVCSPNDYELSLSLYRDRQLLMYPCRCPNNEPVMLRERIYDNPISVVGVYKCERDMPRCMRPDVKCIHGYGTSRFFTVLCICPFITTCKTSRYLGEIRGYCKQ